jgi:hypothetical protein
VIDIEFAEDLRKGEEESTRSKGKGRTGLLGEKR